MFKYFFKSFSSILNFLNVNLEYHIDFQIFYNFTAILYMQSTS